MRGERCASDPLTEETYTTCSAFSFLITIGFTKQHDKSLSYTVGRSRGRIRGGDGNKSGWRSLACFSLGGAPRYRSRCDLQVDSFIGETMWTGVPNTNLSTEFRKKSQNQGSVTNRAEKLTMSSLKFLFSPPLLKTTQKADRSRRCSSSSSVRPVGSSVSSRGDSLPNHLPQLSHVHQRGAVS